MLNKFSLSVSEEIYREECRELHIDLKVKKGLLCFALGGYFDTNFTLLCFVDFHRATNANEQNEPSSSSCSTGEETIYFSVLPFL